MSCHLHPNENKKKWILYNRETPKIMPYKSAIAPPLLSNSLIDSCLSRDVSTILMWVKEEGTKNWEISEAHQRKRNG